MSGRTSELKISAGVSGGLRLFSSKDKHLFDPDIFGDPVLVGKDQFYVGVNAKAKLSAGLTGKASDLSFGFTTGTQGLLTTYTRFEKDAAGSFPDSADALDEAF